jgi:hypothetical protein
MDINWFVQVLKQGETYKAQNTEGESYQVNRPPTSTSIKAANIIQQLSAQLEQNAEITQNLMRQLHDANSQLELFYKIRDQETKKVD